MSYTLHLGDCLDILPTLEAQSVDAVICDPPYGTTACKWDSVIPFEPMWREIKRVLKPRGACVLFGSQPFTSALVMSNPGWFKYEWVWNKTKALNFLKAPYMPLMLHENICVFSGGAMIKGSGRQMKYTPQGVRTVSKTWKRPRLYESDHAYVRPSHKNVREITREGYPGTVLRFGSVHNPPHPTQKPLALLEYLVKTYTDEGDVVLDFAFGSGTTGHACVNLGRRFIGIERDAGYYAIAERRIADAAAAPCQTTLDLTG